MLFESAELDDSIWRLLFTPTMPTGIGASKPAWQVDWLGEEIRYAFGPTDTVLVESLFCRRMTGRDFPIQRDGFLCGTHTLNALARGVLLNPVSIFDTMSAMREPIDSRVPYSLYALREEVVVAALREGVVLGSVLLNDVGQFESLCAEDSVLPAPENKCLEAAIVAAGGLTLLFSTGGGTGGHFVSIVRLDGSGCWALYDSDRVASVQRRLGDVLAHVCAVRMRSGDDEVVGLVPLSVGVSPIVDAWRRSVVRNTAATVGGRTAYVHTPIYTPFNLHGAAFSINARPDVRSDELGLNLFTYYASTNRFEDEMNCKAEEVARCLVSLSPDVAVLNWDPSAPQRLRERMDALTTNLSHLGSLLRSWLAVLFVPCSVLANRDWLRYVVVHHIARRLRDTLTAAAEQTTDKSRLYRIALALCVVAFSWHKHSGDTIENVRDRYPYIHAIYRVASRRSNFADLFGSAGSATDFGRRVAVAIACETHQHHFLGKNRVDRLLWLLHAARHAGIDIECDEAALDALDAGTLDGGDPGDDRNASLELLRRVAFQQPDHDAGVRLTASAQAEVRSGTSTSTVEARRRAMLSQFQSYRHALSADHAATRLFVWLGASDSYGTFGALTADDVAAIERQADTMPHVLEQALVAHGAESLYGIVFDAQHAARRIENPELLTRRCVRDGDDPVRPSSYQYEIPVLVPLRHEATVVPESVLGKRPVDEFD